jgi:hypothetical protein
MIESFLATVENTYTSLPLDKKIDIGSAYVPTYNDNKNYIESKANTEYLGAIKFKSEKIISKSDTTAFPFDKNNLTYPISGETVLILKINDTHYWLPYSVGLYPNYRENKNVSILTTDREIIDTNTANKNQNYNAAKDGVPNIKPQKSDSNKSTYIKNEKIKFLQPKEGDTIISGRVGNTIRFSEFFLTEDGKSSSPGIFIRNKQSGELDSKPIGELVMEDINKDGTSIYVTSNKIKIPFKETIKKQKVAFSKYPNSSDLTGDQLFINSDRIVLSAKASEFIIFGKGNTGVITDGKYSVDAEKEIYLHSNKNILIHSANSNQIFLNSENGKIYLGKNQGEGQVGAPVQQMVLGGELINLFQELIIAIGSQTYLTPSGPSKVGPENFSDFTRISNRLKDILSSTNFLSK